MRAGLLSLVLLVPASAVAHPLDVSYLDMEVDGARVGVRFDIGAPLAIDLAHLPSEQQNPAGLSASAPLLASALLEGGRLESDGADCAWQPDAQATLDGLRLKLSVSAVCPHAPIKLSWSLPFLEDAPLAARTIGKAVVDGHASEFLLAPGRETIALTGSGPGGGGSSLLVGLAYLGLTPGAWREGRGAPAGALVLAFLLVLLTAGGRGRDVGVALLSFLAGQGVGLIAGATGVVLISHRLAESAVALGVMWSALENGVGPLRGWRRAMSLAWGIFAGLGAALALRAAPAGTGVVFVSGLALGQVLVVGVAVAALAAMRRRELLDRRGRRLLTLLLGIAGALRFAHSLLP